MQPIQRIAGAAARQLARTLSGQRALLQAPKVAEVAMRPPDGEAEPLDPAALQKLSRAVVDAVLAMTGQQVDNDELSAVVQRAARKHLMSLPQGGKALAARLAAEAPRLIDLPRLARLAASGLEVSPAQAAYNQDEDELIAGQSPGFNRVLEDLGRVARTDFSVVLLGESGTGKEMLARRLHLLSSRRDGPFVALNCAAVASGLLESELFGHRKGAYTGADSDKLGFIRAANSGTLFLDEIGETGREFQLRLLRVLETREVVPVGGHQGQAVDFRLVCASHRDLEELVEHKGFTPSLMYRIQVVPLSLPPLRRRREDLPALIEHFLQRACQMAKHTRELSPAVIDSLLAFSWPGNVRQLSHALQRMVALSPQYLIGPEMLPQEIAAFAAGDQTSQLEKNLAEIKGISDKHRPQVAELLAAHQGGEVANRDLRQSLGCSDSTAKNILGALCRAGLVSARGSRGGRRYLVKGPEEE